jgi:flagellar biogenesis protein FliO
MTAPAAALLVLVLPWGALRAGGQSSAPAQPATAPGAARADVDRRPVARGSPGGIESKRIEKGKGDSGGWLHTLGALAVVIGLIFAVRIVLRRLAGRQGAGARREAIEVLARASLSARQQVSLVRLGRRLVLVGSGPSGMSPLAEVSDPEEVAELLEEVRSAGPGPFAGLFARHGKAGHAGEPDRHKGEDLAQDEKES